MNLIFMLKNYIKNDYKNVIVTDLLEKRIAQINEHFYPDMYAILEMQLHGTSGNQSEIHYKMKQKLTL